MESNTMELWHGLSTPEDEFRYLYFVYETGKILRSEDNLGTWQKMANEFAELPNDVNAIDWWLEK